MDDLISRRAAIDALRMDIDIIPFAKAREYARAVIETIHNRLEELPSVQLEPKWIPVDKELPEDGTKCLVTQKFGRVRHVSKATYACDLYKVNQYDFCDKKNTVGFYYFDDEYGYVEALDVTAWMPLPEPYREEGDS